MVPIRIRNKETNTKEWGEVAKKREGWVYRSITNAPIWTHGDRLQPYLRNHFILLHKTQEEKSRARASTRAEDLIASRLAFRGKISVKDPEQLFSVLVYDSFLPSYLSLLPFSLRIKLLLLTPGAIYHCSATPPFPSPPPPPLPDLLPALSPVSSFPLPLPLLPG